MDSIYQCPVCGQKLAKALSKSENAFRCGANHSYDISKEGYVNLLLANQKRTKEPGDSKEMIAHRKFFLELGYYDDLSDWLNKTVSELIKKYPAPANILDVGCGEGYYAARLQEFTKKSNQSAQLWAIDISKPAIQKAAKRDPDIQWSIGSSFQLPYLTESLDIIFSIFSPFDPKEISRVLKPKGKLIVIRPGKNHLKELASLIYDKFELQGNPAGIEEYPGLQRLKTFELTYQIHLKNKKEIESLIGMTPYFWSLNQEKKSQISEKQELKTTVDFQISIFQK